LLLALATGRRRRNSDPANARTPRRNVPGFMVQLGR
jgi:hypothetical protein